MKLLRFFGVDADDKLSVGAAGWEIARILEDDENRERWRRYLFVTKDFDSDSPNLKPFTREALDHAVVPADWDESAAVKEFREELVAKLLDGVSPFDVPSRQSRSVGAPSSSLAGSNLARARSARRPCLNVAARSSQTSL